MALDDTTGLSDEEQVARVVKHLEATKKHHDIFVRRFERLERAYRGIVNPRSKAASWRNVVTPPYAFQLIETVVANTVEEGLRLKATPTPTINSSLEEITAMLDKSQAVENLLRAEHRIDEMDAKQRPLFLSDAICGMGVGTSRWAYNTGPFVEQYVDWEDVYHPETEEHIGRVPQLKQRTSDRVIRDHSTFEVIDPRDFMLHESAKCLQPCEPGGAQYVLHRCWYSMEQLLGFEAGGYMQNVKDLTNSRDQTVEYSERETALWNINRTKDLIEVIECWEYRNSQIMRTIVGNRKVLLAPMTPSPFNHGEYPFVIANSMPQLFTTTGMSTVELVEKLQEMLWTLQSQRLDNIELINNAILLIRADIDDPEAFEWFPGARWPVQSPSDVAPFQPPYQLAGLTLEAESVLKGDLQNVTSAAPLAGGVSGNVDQKTATGVSIIMSNAQKALQARKNQAMKALVREANMRIKNCQQFISDTRLVHEIGPNGVSSFRSVDPIDYKGEFAFEIEEGSESIMRQEKRAEAMQWLQVITGLAPVMAASATPLDLKQIVMWAARKWDIYDAEKFFSAQPASLGAAGQPGGQTGPPGGGDPSGAAPPGGPNLGVTSSTAVDASQPSATGGISASPSMFLQRALAMGGGPNNSGGS